MYLFRRDVIMKKIGEAHLGKSYNKDFLVIPVVKPL